MSGATTVNDQGVKNESAEQQADIATKDVDDKRQHIHRKAIRLGFEEYYPGHKRDSFWIVHKRAKGRQSVDSLTRGCETFGYHTSEFGWNLPRSHDRHLLNFPAEILTNIMSFVLVAPVPVTPLTVTCNWLGKSKSHPLQPCYRINDRDKPELPCCFSTIPDGSSGEVGVECFRAPIDATSLRVSKYFFEEGRKLLYGQNIFEFDLNTNAYTAKYDSIYNLDPNGRVKHRYKDMPLSEELQSEEVEEEIREMINQSCPEKLPDWQYCDPFTRFLYSIGPTNAAYIKKFRITGTLGPSHEWSDNKQSGRMQDDYHNLSYYLKAYSPFLERYCENLESLEISATNIAISYWARLTQGRSINIYEDKYRKRRRGIGNKFFSFGEDEDDYYLEAALVQFEEIQNGDETMDAGGDILKGIRTAREEQYYTLKAKLLFMRQNCVVLSLKPLFEEICPKLKNLRSLIVKRPPQKPWTAYDLKYNEEHKSDWVDATWNNSILVDWVPDIQHKIDIAAFKRWKELEKMKEEKERTNKEKEEMGTNRGRGNTSRGPIVPIFTLNTSGNHNSRGGLNGSYGSKRGGGSEQGNQGNSRGSRATPEIKKDSLGGWGWSKHKGFN